jgi:hypothetical protein
MKYFFIISLIFTSSFCNYKELLFNGNCVTCHRVDNLNKSAPTIQEIRQRYIEAFPIKKDFVEYMSNWVLKPDANTSLMMDAIEKYELMPELAFDKRTLEEISEFIYENDFK